MAALTHFSFTNPSSPRGEQNSPFLACHVASNSNFILLLLVSFLKNQLNFKKFFNFFPPFYF